MKTYRLKNSIILILINYLKSYQTKHTYYLVHETVKYILYF